MFAHYSISRFLKRRILPALAEYVIRYRWLIIGIVGVLTLFLGWQATKVGLNADFSTYLAEDDPLVRQYNRIGDIYGGNETGIVLVNGSDIFTPDNLQLVDRLTNAFERVEGIAYVTSLSNVIDFETTDWGLEVGRLLPDDERPSPKRTEALRTRVMGNDRYVEQLVSADATTAAILLRFEGSGEGNSQFATARRVKEAAETVLGGGRPSGTDVYYGGMPFLVFNMTLLIGENLSVLVPLIVLLLVLMLYLGFRHWAGVLFPMLVVGVSVIWVAGIMGAAGLKFDLLTGIMPVVLLALGSADGIHLMKRYFERRRTGDAAPEAAGRVFHEMGTPILLTTVTTMVGFAALAVSDFSVIRQFGLLTALGILLALVVTLLLLPALLSFGVDAPPARSARPGGRMLDRLSTWVYRHKPAVLGGGLFVLVVSAAAIPMIVKSVDWTLCLAPGSDPYHAEMLLRDKFGGSLPVQVQVNGDVNDPAVLRTMTDIERRLGALDHVSGTGSMASLLSEMNDVMNGRYVVPVGRRGVSNLRFLLEGEEIVDQMVARSDREALVQAKLDTWNTGPLVTTVTRIDSFLAGLPAEVAVVKPSAAAEAERKQLDTLRHRQMRRELTWTFQKAGVPVAADRTGPILNALFDAIIDTDAREQMARAGMDYLMSAEAEVVLPRETAAAIIAAVTRELTYSEPIGADRVRAVILEHASEVSGEDASYLAMSLAEVVRVARGEARLQPALAALGKMVPGVSQDDDQFRREVKGILWTVNDDQFFVDADAVRHVLGVGSPAILRTTPVTASQTGLPPVLKRMEEELTPTQVQSLLMTLGFVILLLALIFGSPAAGLLAIVPISLTILVNFGVMGYAGIGLDSFTAMIASVAIGLGIDTDIHFISRLRDELRVDGDRLAALKRTVRTTGVSVLINALAVGLGFLVLLAAGGQHIRRFGGLTALTVLVSAGFSLTVLPALLLWAQPRFLKKAAARGRGQTEEVAETGSKPYGDGSTKGVDRSGAPR